VKPLDIFNSKTKKIRIELPHYSFSHSSSGDSPHAFIGRERVREKLKKIIEDSPDEPGVYLIAGNRGVGKTSLVSWVINETSLKTKSNLFENLRYLILLLFFVAGTQFCLQVFNIIPDKHPKILAVVSSLIFALSFILLCCFNSYRRKMPKHNIGLKILDSIASAFKELGYLINPYDPYGKAQYLLKIILVVSFTQLVSVISKIISPTIAFFGYLAVVFVCNMFFRFVKSKLRKNKQKNKKYKLSKNDTSILLKLKSIFLVPFWNYLKNHNRMYLRINFGHKLNDEKDILRLIARTLGAEYNRFSRSFRRMLPRRVLVFGILILFACLFTPVVEQQEFYKILIKDIDLYNASSQALLEKDKERLKGAFDKVVSCPR